MRHGSESHAATIWKPDAPNPSPMHRGRPGGHWRYPGRTVALYFISKQGFARLDPETGFAEIVSEERFDSFALSPDGRRAVGVKEGSVTPVDLEFSSSGPLQVNSGALDELELGQITAARERWLTQRQRRATSYAELRELPGLARKAIGVEQVRWVGNKRLWCVVRTDTGTQVGIAQLY